MSDDLFTAAQPPKNDALTVSELSRQLKGTVEDRFSDVRVQGEISGFKRAASGHCYMQLKDDDAALKAIIWKGVAGRINLELEDGQEVIAIGKLTTYEARSEYQIIISHLEIAGIGALLKQIEDRRRRLDAEGLFAIDKKKPLPAYPQRLGIITSETGAVIQDIINRLELRLALDIHLIGVNVQGDRAAPQICEAIRHFNTTDRKPDVIIIARGGGSIEDLMPFNDEAIVRAVAASEIPIVSAVGHETDTTLIDYAADMRAPTPTAAAEQVVALKSHIMEEVAGYFASMQKSMRQSLAMYDARLKEQRLPKPSRLLEMRQQRLDDMGERLHKAIKTSGSTYQLRLEKISGQLRNPKSDLLARNQRNQETLKHYGNSVTKYMQDILARKQTHLLNTGQLLENSDYRKTMERGFAIIRTKKDEGWVAHASADSLQQNDEVNIAFHDGDIDAIIKAKKI